MASILGAITPADEDRFAGASAFLLRATGISLQADQVEAAGCADASTSRSACSQSSKSWPSALPRCSYSSNARLAIAARRSSVSTVGPPIARGSNVFLRRRSGPGLGISRRSGILLLLKLRTRRAAMPDACRRQAESPVCGVAIEAQGQAPCPRRRSEFVRFTRVPWLTCPHCRTDGGDARITAEALSFRSGAEDR